jgi:hypothetical protein
VKTFFVIAGLQNIAIAIAILAFFLASSNFHKMKITTVNLKSSILVWFTKKFHQKKLKSAKDMLKWSSFSISLGGQPREGVVHGPNPCIHCRPVIFFSIIKISADAIFTTMQEPPSSMWVDETSKLWMKV